ncbi:hypothetical protein Tco_1202005 [Tanacetum coccineum]
MFVLLMSPQDEFMKIENVTEIGDQKLWESEKVSEKAKRREKLLEVARGRWRRKGEGDGWELGDPGLRPRAPVTAFPSHEILLTRESLGLDPLVLVRLGV